MNENGFSLGPDIFNFLKHLNQKVINTKNTNVVYSANFGSYDNLTDVNFIEEGIDYIYFTDNPKIKSSSWNIILLENISFDPRMAARVIKHLPHMFLKNYESSMWIDAQIKIDKVSPKKLFIELSDSDYICFKNWHRNRVYLEVLACIRIGHDSIYKILSQYLKYKFNGFKDDRDLIASGVLLRKHLKQNIINFQEEWMYQIYSKSIRDQLSFNYVADVEDLNYSIFNENMQDFFSLSKHKRYGYYKNNKLKIPLQRKIYKLLERLKNK